MSENIDVRAIPHERIDEFISLHSEILSEVQRTYINWRYKENPFTVSKNHYPIVGAFCDGELVGGLGGIPIRFKLNQTEFIGRQPANLVIHPDYRSAGLFINLVKKWRKIDQIPESALEYGWCSGETGRLWKKIHNWNSTHNVRAHRLQNPKKMFDRKSEIYYISRICGIPLKIVLKFLDSICLKKSSDISVSVHDGIESKIASDLYKTSVPNQLHAVRDQEYLEWRYDEPNKKTTTFVARQNEEVIGVAVTQIEEQKYVVMQDILPLPLKEIDKEAMMSIIKNIILYFKSEASITSPILQHNRWWKAGFWTSYFIELLPDKVVPPIYEKVYPSMIGYGGRWNFAPGGMTEMQLPDPSQWEMNGFELE